MGEKQVRPQGYYKKYYQEHKEKYFALDEEYRKRNEKNPRNIAAGESLRRERRKLGLTQAELAKLLGTGMSTIHYWETAQIPVNVKRIAAVFPELAEAIALPY